MQRTSTAVLTATRTEAAASPAASPASALHAAPPPTASPAPWSNVGMKVARGADKLGEFTWSETDEPHATRRQLIMAAHPEIAELFGTEPLTFWISLGILIGQLCMAWLMRDADLWLLLVCAYVIGGTANHSLQLAVHELSHDLCWSGRYKDVTNRLTAIMANFATGFPSGQTFKPYHMDHHQYQGVDGVDTDIPHAIELNLVTNTLAKIVWIICQPFCYALRPMLIKAKPFRFWEALNLVAQMAFNACVIYFMGARSMAYLVAGTLLGLGLHPAAGHFIAEHYEFVAGHETYSYYGPLNRVNFNVGYHNEHHDFPRIPWSRLPRVREIAPEFYEHLPYYTSYVTQVFLPYILDPEMGVWCRVKRRTSAKVYSTLAKTTDTRTLAPFKVAAFAFMFGSLGFILYGLAAGAKAGVAVQ